jgi:ribonuclease HI
VECISDISNASGTLIQDAWYSPETTKPSTSAKQWPLQKNPGKEAWSIWRRFLQRAYNDSNGRLKKPLGDWTALNKLRHYLHYWNADSQCLITKNNFGQWKQYKLHHEDRRYYYFATDNGTNTDVLEPLIPLDLTKQNQKYFVTNKPASLVQAKGSQNNNKDDEQAQQYHEIIVTKTELQQLLETKTLIDIATDGSHDPETGKMAYGWVIAIGETIIAKGKGPAGGHPKMASSFRAEACGLRAAAITFNTIVNTYKVSATKFKIFIHLDSKALIGRMQTYQDHQTTAKSYQWPDADITVEAHNWLKDLDRQYQHIKSHQTCSKGNKLSFPATLNIMADELAKAQSASMEKPLLTVQGETSLVCIGNQFITRDLQKNLLDAASQQPIREYLMTKHDWTQKIFHSINWELQQTVMSTYDINDQQRILKFVHNWLPTNARLYREQQQLTTRCPLCFYRNENNYHLFSCTHPKQVAIKDQLIGELEGDKTDPLAVIIAAAIQKGLRDHNWTPPPDETRPQQLQNGIAEQNKIGWNQVIFGRVANKLLKANDLQEAARMRRIIRKIWDAFLQLWQQRNAEVHGSEQTTKAQSQKQALMAKIERCYSFKDRVKAQDRNKIFTKEKAELLQEQPNVIKNWIRMAENLIRIHRRENKQANNRNQMMEQYFKWHPPDSIEDHISNDVESGSTIHVG